MTGLTRRCALLVALLAVAARAAAQPAPSIACAEPNGVPGGPLHASLLDGELGRAHRACPASEVALGGHTLVVNQPDEFYGRLQAAGVVRASWAPADTMELHLRFEFLRYDAVISSVEADALGTGHLTLGGTRLIAEGERTRLALGARAVLPTASALYRHTWPLGFDLLALGEYRAHRLLRLHGGAGPLVSFGTGGGPAQARVGFSTTAGARWLPWRWMAVVFELYAQVAYTAALDVFALGPGLRFGGERFGAELSATLPVAGRERALLAGVLQLGGRL